MVAADRGTSSRDAESIFRLPRGRHADRVSRESALEALAAVELADLAGESAGEMSHGTQRLLEVARAIAQKPRFVLLDEPAAGLSAGDLVTLQQVIRALADAGIGVLLVEHNVAFVFDIADEMTVLHQGAVLARGSAEEIANHPEVADVYLGVAGVAV
jgi:branched-chain amino acid transport system permease protein